MYPPATCQQILLTKHRPFKMDNSKFRSHSLNQENKLPHLNMNPNNCCGWFHHTRACCWSTHPLSHQLSIWYLSESQPRLYAGKNTDTYSCSCGCQVRVYLMGRKARDCQAKLSYWSNRSTARNPGIKILFLRNRGLEGNPRILLAWPWIPSCNVFRLRFLHSEINLLISFS